MASQFRRSHMRVEKVGELTVVKLATDDLGEAHAHAVSDELNALADSLVRPRLQLDLGAVRFLTSTALGKLVGLHKRVEAVGGQLALVNLTELVYEIFDVSRLTQLLDIRRPGTGGDSATSSPALAS